VTLVALGVAVIGSVSSSPYSSKVDSATSVDEIAKRVVAAGGGTHAGTDATDLRTLKQVADLIDPAILTRAFANDALQLTQPPLALKPRPRPRRLVPDAALIRRRAAGEPLRQLAHDYHVNHTTLSRYFARTEVKRQLQHARRQLRQRRFQTGASTSSVSWLLMAGVERGAG
jgi:hypothetical protein